MGKPYFQFPLCTLALPGSGTDRLDHIISFCCVEVGKHLWKKLSYVQQENWRRAPPVPEWQNLKFDPTKDRHLEALMGADRLNVRLGHVPSTIRRHANLAQHVYAFEQRHGADVKVRLATEYVFECRDKKGLSFAELAVLAGIYGKIGASKGPVRITRREIWYRAHGCKSKQVFLRIIGLCPPVYKERQVRSLIESLHQRHFFARVTFARRQTYYSHRLTAKELEDAVFHLKIRRTQAQFDRICANNDLTKRIQSERQRLATAAALNDGQSGAT